MSIGKPRRISARATAYVLAAISLGASPTLAAPPAFPGAQGFGAVATGGRGGAVVHVTNLNDSGPGSLRDAVSREKRIVVFDVGGVIEIKSPLTVASDITLAGQSAPGPGVTVYGDSVSFSNRRNIIVRHLRFRQGIESGRGAKTINVTSGSTMIFDHVSAGWGRWDTLGVTKNSTDITFQHCLFAEAIDPQRFGGLIDSSRRITLVGNLWMNNQSRNPKIKGDLQYVNNVVYNWGASGVPGGHSAAVWRQDVVNNVFVKGPNSTDTFLDMFAATDHVYQSGNVADLNRDGLLNGRGVVPADFKGDTPPTFQSASSNKPPVPVHTVGVTEAYLRIVASVGASRPRDAIDRRLIEQLTSLGVKGAIIRRESEVGGQPRVPVVTRPAGFDTDRDGMPDAWERANGMNPNDPKDGNKDANGDGYTNVENYLNSLVSPPESTAPRHPSVISAEFANENAPYPSCHASTIVENATGQIVAAWFGGTRERDPDVGIWVGRRENGRWLPAVEVATGVQPDGTRLPTWNPVLFQPPTGPLVLFYKVGPNPRDWWGMMMTSPDGGKTWGPPRRLPDGVLGPIKNKPVALADGSWLSPSSTEGTPTGWRVHFERTRDAGRTWEIVGPVPKGKGEGFDAIQPSLLLYRDGRLQALSRTRDGVVAGTWSRDNGTTWSPLESIGLPNPNSGTDAVTLADGRQLIVYNHSATLPETPTKGLRHPLDVAISTDGITWKRVVTLETEPRDAGYAYPAVIQAADGRVHITYTWDRKLIKHVVLDPAKL